MWADHHVLGSGRINDRRRHACDTTWRAGAGKRAEFGCLVRAVFYREHTWRKPPPVQMRPATGRNDVNVEQHAEPPWIRPTTSCVNRSLAVNKTT
jgi:hypothetical protein